MSISSLPFFPRCSVSETEGGLMAHMLLPGHVHLVIGNAPSANAAARSCCALYNLAQRSSGARRQCCLLLPCVLLNPVQFACLAENKKPPIPADTRRYPPTPARYPRYPRYPGYPGYPGYPWAPGIPGIPGIPMGTGFLGIPSRIPIMPGMPMGTWDTRDTRGAQAP